VIGDGPSPRRHLHRAALAARDGCRMAEAADMAVAAFAATTGDAAEMRTELAILAATLLRQDGRAAQAAGLLEQAIESQPGRAELWNHLGLARRAACRPGPALDAFRRAAQLDPDNPWAETNMAFSLLRDPADPVASFAELAEQGGRDGVGLGLFCDRFPHTYGFLLQQFQTYLRHFPDCRAYSFGRKVLEPYDRGQFGAAMAAWAPCFPALAPRVHQLVPVLDDAPARARLARPRVAQGRFHRPALAHNIFAMNADLFRPLYEELAIPFTFTLNPGGGFRLDDPYSDDRLARVFASPMFRHVIVTYQLTRDYIQDRFKVPDHRVTLLPGTIVVESLLMAHRRPKRRFGVDKDSLDVCFGGLRYTPTGTDKGYDRFVAAAHVLARRFPRLRFHVFGDYGPHVIDVSAIADRVVFHGPRDQTWLAAFYADMDAIVSPNMPDQITRGAFDGFPVTTCIEAAMCGVALFATDPKGLNFALTDGIDYVSVDPDPAALARCLEDWLADPARLYALAEKGEARTRAVWGEDAQMKPRVQLFSDLLRG
jgi:glycosyltransferase involved in cell wall biosynthesis